MKAITLWQPWASLLSIGAKEYETRSWSTKYRGPIAIHAAKKKTITPWEGTINPEIWRAMQKVLSEYGINLYYESRMVPAPSDYVYKIAYGAIIATAELVGCHKMVLHSRHGLWIETDHGRYEPTEKELLFGNWTPGRYAWELANIQELPDPVPAKGKQGIWEWEEDQNGYNVRKL